MLKTFSVILVFLLMVSGLQAQTTFKKTLLIMGTRFEITVVARDTLQASQYIQLAVDEIQRIEGVISSWDPASETSEINRNAGMKPTVVSQELFSLIQRCITLSKVTDGAFDISFAAMDPIWKFDGSLKEIPAPEAISTALQKVGYQNILLNTEEHSVYLKNKGMKIGFGAIGKGYAADQAKKRLMEVGVSAGIINAAGDMTTWGRQPDGREWMVAITNPLDKQKAFALLPMKEGAVVTSGDYEKFIFLDGIRYSHIIDPRTGYPATELISVTVFAPKAELADALATSIFVMGREAGLDRLEQLSSAEGILIDATGHVYTTSNISLTNKL